jgi:Uma2 family endonuclease
MTLAEFMVWEPPEISVCPWQLVDGVPVAMVLAPENQGALRSEIGRQIGNCLRAAGGRSRVIGGAGIVPRVRAGDNYRIADLAVTCAPPSTRVTVADPVLAIEILSPSNETETWSNVWTYTTIPSMQEILVISSMKIEAELLRRNDDGSWPEEPSRIGPDGTLTLTSIGFSVVLRDLYGTTSLTRA